MTRFEKADFDWPSYDVILIWSIKYIKSQCMLGGVFQFFESLMFVYYQKQEVENVEQGARWFH